MKLTKAHCISIKKIRFKAGTKPKLIRVLPLTTVDQVHSKQGEPAKRKGESGGLEGKTDTLTFYDIKFTFLSQILHSSLSNLGGYKSKKDTYFSFHFLSLYKPNK